MTKSFADKQAYELYAKGKSKKFPADVAPRAARKFEYVNLVEQLREKSGSVQSNVYLIRVCFAPALQHTPVHSPGYVVSGMPWREESVSMRIKALNFSGCILLLRWPPRFPCLYRLPGKVFNLVLETFVTQGEPT